MVVGGGVLLGSSGGVGVVKAEVIVVRVVGFNVAEILVNGVVIVFSFRMHPLIDLAILVADVKIGGGEEGWRCTCL